MAKQEIKVGDIVRIKQSGGKSLSDTTWEVVKLLPACGCLIREAGTNYAAQRFDVSCLVKG